MRERRQLSVRIPAALHREVRVRLGRYGEIQEFLRRTLEAVCALPYNGEAEEPFEEGSQTIAALANLAKLAADSR